MLKFFAVILFTCKTMYNKTIIRLGFCDIQNNRGLGKCYQVEQLPGHATLGKSLLLKSIKNGVFIIINKMSVNSQLFIYQLTTIFLANCQLRVSVSKNQRWSLTSRTQLKIRFR